MKLNLDYGIICNYIECQAYSTELNMTYYASIADSSSAISDIYTAMKQNGIGLQDLLDPKYKMDYLIYVDQVYMEIINQTLTIAFNNLNNHISITKKESNTRIVIQYSMLGALLLVCCYELGCFLRTRKRTIGILDLFKDRRSKYNSS